MAKSMLDQLKAAGLVDEKKVKQAKKQKHQQRKQQGKGKPAGDEARQAAQQARQARAERDRALNRRQKAAAEAKALAAQVRQLIEANRRDTGQGEIAYHFSDQDKVRRLFLDAGQQRQLARGQLAIARLNEEYALVPAATAEKIRQRDSSCLILWHEEGEQTGAAEKASDDPYADFPVPDDLMW